MGRAGTAADILFDERSKVSVTQPNRLEAPKPAGYRWPELFIIRQTNIDWPNNQKQGEDWNEFLNALGRLNRGKGKAFALGAMACSYVTAVEMGKMLQKRYPDVYENRAKTIQMHRRFARHYNEFVSRKERAGLEAVFAKTERMRVFEESEAFTGVFSPDEIGDQAYGDIVLEVPKPGYIGWNLGTFAVKGLQKYSRNELGLDLSPNDQLYNEWQETIDYCRHEGLDTKFIDRNREPHLVVFETFGVLGSVMLKAPNNPGKIALDPPAALVNTN